MRGWGRVIVAVTAVASGVACDSTGERGASVPPSVLLVVLDTTRRDAVSAYGAVDGTTPYLDSLARDGLRYEWALAPSPWTLPSHATLFTSLGPEVHGIGIDGRMVLEPRFATLAERMSDAGYQTLGFSENPLVTHELGLTRGFDRFVGEMDANRMRRLSPREVRFDVAHQVASWADARATDAPFFVFVNLFDPHDPYVHRDSNPFLPRSADAAHVARLGGDASTRGIAESLGICSRLPPRSDLEILRALYLDEVRSADAKLAAIHETLMGAAQGRLITIVTADHGEHLGEHGLLGHEFSVRSEVIRVPLVVHGLPRTPPAVVDARVGLVDVAPSILAWSGIERPGAWTGLALPESAQALTRERSWFAWFSDARLVAPDGARAASRSRKKRRGCSEEDRVHGDLLAVIRYPFKLVEYERASPQLYDLRWDEREVSDLAAKDPARVGELGDALTRWRERASGLAERDPRTVSPEIGEALRALGYVE